MSNEKRAVASDSIAFRVGIGASLLLTLLIWAVGSRLVSVPHLPDAGASWYYWKLPEPDAWARATAWVLYALHQIAVWGALWWGQRRGLTTKAGLRGINYFVLGANVLFSLLHVVQTHIWYDGLAQDVSIWSSQASVILMLVLVLIMENRRRGLFWGKPAPLPTVAMDLVRCYHGYLIGWATVYTFWYHPTEATSGHLIGFFYMFLLFLQSSLMFTRAHVDRRWTTLLEVFVLFHGTLVAVMQGNGMWPMFGFGFGGVFVVTQMHGLRLSKRVRWALLAAYVALALLVYGMRGIGWIHQVTWIPIIQYALAFVLSFLVAGVARLLGQGGEE